MVAGGGAACDQPVLRARQRSGDRTALVSLDGVDAKGTEGAGEDHRHRAAEGPQPNGVALGEDSGAASAGERSLGRRVAPDRQGRASILANEGRL